MMSGERFRAPGPVLAAAWLVVAIAIGALLVLGSDILVPLAIAILLWNLINALATWYVRTAQFLTPFHFLLPRGLALALGALTVALLVWLGVQLVADNVGRLAEDTPAVRDTLRQGLPLLAERLGVPLPAPVDELYAQIPFGNLLAQTAASLTQVAGSAGLILVYILFLLIEQRSFEHKLHRLLPDPVHAARARNVLHEIERRIETYLRIKTLMSVLTGGCSYAVLAFFGVDYAGFWALLIFLLNYIPNIGSILGVVFPTLLALVQFDDLFRTLVMAGLLASLQVVIGNLLEPKLMGQRLNLSPLVIIVSLAFWGSVWGVAGLFLSVPLTMMIAIACAQVRTLRPVAIMLSVDGRLD